ncbi:MAG TPA: hypothetical protein VEC11_13005 [Allosphingosinicella sp.]|nr:hypothetical protein [Allosphingosinicella sp.]
MGLLAILAQAVLAAAPGDGAPDLRRTGEGQLIVDAPDRRRATYRLRFDPGTRLAAAERLGRLLDLEPFEILAEDTNAATATVRLTPTGAAMLASPDSWQHLAATSITPRAPTRLPRCVGIVIDLQGERSEVGGAEPCPRSQVATQLVVEGLNARGARLWVAAADDPRLVRSVMGPNGEPHLTARDERQPVFAEIAVPTIAGLSTIRWYEVTPDNRLRRIGQTRWRRSR